MTLRHEPYPYLTTREMFRLEEWLRTHRPERYVGPAQPPVRIHVRTDRCLYERTYTAYDADQERDHLRALATSKAPGLPIIGRRRRRFSFGNLIAWWIDRAWRGHP